MNPKDIQWPPLRVQDLKPEGGVSATPDRVRFPTLKAALLRASVLSSGSTENGEKSYAAIVAAAKSVNTQVHDEPIKINAELSPTLEQLVKVSQR